MSAHDVSVGQSGYLIESARIFWFIMIGTRLAHYEITSHLGSGGMGDVYQATDSKWAAVSPSSSFPKPLRMMLNEQLDSSAKPACWRR